MLCSFVVLCCVVLLCVVLLLLRVTGFAYCYIQSHADLCRTIKHSTLQQTCPPTAAISWTHTPTQPTHVSIGSNVTLKWDFDLLESKNQTLLFLVITRFDPQSVNNESSLVLKLADGRIEVYKEFEGRVELKDKATLVLYNVTWSDETSYCCQVYCSDVAERRCTQLFVLGKWYELR